MNLHPKQKEVIESDKRFRVLNWGAGTGKTALAVEFIGYEAVHPRHSGKVVYIAPTEKQAREIVWKRLVDRYESISTHVNEQRKEITVKNIEGGESIIYLRGFESIENLRGNEYDAIVLDEVAMMRNFDEGWKQVLRPRLRMSKGPALFISTPKGYNHFYDLCESAKLNRHWGYFHATSYDNPYIDPDEINAAKEDMDPISFEQEYMGEFRKHEGLVYHLFDENLHTYENYTGTIQERLAFIDFGYSTSPTAILECFIDEKGHMFIDKEIYRKEMLISDITEYVKSMNPHKVYADPARPEAIADMRKAGIVCVDVHKGPDSVKTGIDLVTNKLRSRQLKINKRCENTLYEFMNYSYNDKGEPLKVHDHALDGLRYGVMTYNPSSIIKTKQALVNANINQIRRGLTQKKSSATYGE